MSNEIINVSYCNKPCYDIVISTSFDKLSEAINSMDFHGRKITIITDSNVMPLYSEQLKSALAGITDKIFLLSIPAGENHKNLDTVDTIYDFLIKHHMDRHDLMIALGGGVVGDITGFAASTYLRGIAFIQIPTTLLAQTDSSIGGKTGVDFKGYKNMVGAFYMPKLVYMNISVLKSLDARQYASGFAEIMKHGLIKDQKYYLWLIDNMYEINERDPDTLIKMIKRSCEIKRDVVERDPKEHGERALLNFGHTIGHAIEKYRNFELLHGECVALGCIAAAYISYKRDLLDKDSYYEIRDMFVPFGLPISVDNIDIDNIYEIMKSDKKVDSGIIKFVLLKDIGKAEVVNDVNEDEIKAAIKEILYVESND